MPWVSDKKEDWRQHRPGEIALGYRPAVRGWRLVMRNCSLGLSQPEVAKADPKKFDNLPDLGSDGAMATTHAFGPFRLDVDAEILFRGSEPLPVGKRAVALLRVLIDRAGAPVSKDTLIDAAWSGLAVEESNLTVQIAALRRVLGVEPGGDKWIETLPRRGYRFVGPVIKAAPVRATDVPG